MNDKLNGLEITNVNIFNVNKMIMTKNGKERHLIGIARVTFNKLLEITGIRLFRLDEDGKIYIEFPMNPHSKSNTPFSRPLNNDIRNAILEAIKTDYLEEAL